MSPGEEESGSPSSAATALVAAPRRSTVGRARWNLFFNRLCVITAILSVAILVVLLASILYQGLPSLSRNLLVNPPASDPQRAGIWPAMMGTIWVCGLCALFTLPAGVATAILLEEFPPKSRIGRFFHGLVQLNISNLAGVPSIVYGILGVTAFVTTFGMFSTASDTPAIVEVGAHYYDLFMSEGDRAILVSVADQSSPVTKPSGELAFRDKDLRPVEVRILEPGGTYPEDDAELAYALFSDAEPGRISKPSWYYFRLPFGRGVLTGALTLMLVVLPIVIISSQEALRAVPSSLRAGALGLGATPWQVIWNVTLPAAVPGIMTGSILAMSRAIGEAAPLLMISGVVFISQSPRNLMDDFSVMPLQIYNWAGRPQSDFHYLAAAGIILLLLILLSFNGLAVWIRQKLQKPLS